jgi:hypothetical protein
MDSRSHLMYDDLASGISEGFEFPLKSNVLMDKVVCTLTMLKGTITVHKHDSKILRSNPLRDPHIRDLIIYLPPEYTKSSSRGYIAVFGLVGFGGQGKMLLNTDPLKENIEDKMNRLISEKKCGPMVLVLLDCFTRFGGNQHTKRS